MSSSGSTTSTFISTIEGTISNVASAASSFVLSELGVLAVEELGILKDVILRAINDAEEADTIGETVADVLTILENENKALFDKLESDLIQALVALGLVKNT